MPMLSTRGSASARALGMAGAQRARRSFVYVSDALQSFTVPANVSSVTVEIAGGGGGGASNTANTGGGRGGDVVTGRLSVTPSSTLYVAAAQAGCGNYVEYSTGIVFQFAGGWPGGGSSGTGSLPYPSARSGAGSGGGYSGIFSANSLTQGNILALAAGGGGRANVGGATSGGNATTSTGGTSGGTTGATAGSALQGGTGGTYDYAGGYPGGGGGGGYYGGGGGAGSSTTFGGNGPGGMGSSYYTAALVPAATAAEVNTKPGYVTIAW